jgi:7,8-dihydropterin-6-yl-methyl-4-(beta-D-ribofuranosyl)aminobenzene 5'-phosphate synthase
MKRIAALLLMLFTLIMGSASAQESPARVTILYDAFGTPSTLKRGWGYSALIEYGGRRVLFDTGGDSDDFAYNVKTLGIELTRLDFVVLTHRHGDHTSGLSYVLSLNPGVKVYTPVDAAAFGRAVSGRGSCRPAARPPEAESRSRRIRVQRLS